MRLPQEFAARTLAASVVVLLVASPGRAQAPGTASPAAPSQQSFESLDSRLPLGIEVGVTLRDGATRKGKLVDLSPSHLLIAFEGRKERIDAASVARITRRDPGSGRKGALIGLAIGAGTGLAAAALQCHSGSWSCSSSGYVSGPLVWGAVGAATGALIARHTRHSTVVYERPEARASLRIAPVTGRERAGGAFIISW